MLDQATCLPVELFYLPSYSREFNPAEYPKQNVKTNAVGSQRPADQNVMITNVRR